MGSCYFYHSYYMYLQCHYKVVFIIMHQQQQKQMLLVLLHLALLLPYNEVTTRMMVVMMVILIIMIIMVIMIVMIMIMMTRRRRRKRTIILLIMIMITIVIKITILISNTIRAPVFDRHQFFSTLEHYGKAHGSLLSGWMNYNCTACCWFPTSSNILILLSQFWQIRFESCWLHWSKVLNTCSFTVL